MTNTFYGFTEQWKDHFARGRWKRPMICAALHQAYGVTSYLSALFLWYFTDQRRGKKTHNCINSSLTGEKHKEVYLLPNLFKLNESKFNLT